MNINLNYWRNVAKEVLNDKYAKVGFKVVEGTKVFKPATDRALQRIRYRINEQIKREEREFGCFAVFTSLQYAELFKSKGYGSHILLVGYVPCRGRDKGRMWKKNPLTLLEVEEDEAEDIIYNQEE